MKFCRLKWNDNRKNPLNFGDDPDHIILDLRSRLNLQTRISQKLTDRFLIEDLFQNMQIQGYNTPMLRYSKN